MSCPAAGTSLPRSEPAGPSTCVAALSGASAAVIRAQSPPSETVAAGASTLTAVLLLLPTDAGAAGAVALPPLGAEGLAASAVARAKLAVSLPAPAAVMGDQKLHEAEASAADSKAVRHSVSARGRPRQRCGHGKPARTCRRRCRCRAR